IARLPLLSHTPFLLPLLGVRAHLAPYLQDLQTSGGEQPEPISPPLSGVPGAAVVQEATAGPRPARGYSCSPAGAAETSLTERSRLPASSCQKVTLIVKTGFWDLCFHVAPLRFPRWMLSELVFHWQIKRF
uniref:Uncharacterized protein n=1 Tax=Apteryx owenii TaxID=8824 RepID=A0A8B9Q872_APTOW